MQITQKNFYKKFLGRAGEIKACEYLKEKGYVIEKTNYKTRIGEIDVIAKDNGTLVFVEVKTRTDDSFGSPSEAVNFTKQSKYFKVATQYIIATNQNQCECRFDVIEIEDGKINHIIDAFCM